MRRKGQATFEYFILFVVITALTIPLLSGSFFTGAKDAGKAVFKVCVNRITGPANPGPGEPQGPADITLQRNFPNPFEDFTRFAMVIKDNSCDFDIIITNVGGSEVGKVECRNMVPGTYAWEGNPGIEPAPIWYPDPKLASGKYFWRIKMVGANADIHNIHNNNGLKMSLVK